MSQPTKTQPAYRAIAGLSVHPLLSELVQELLRGRILTPDRFWKGFADILEDLGPENKRLLWERDRLQAAIGDFYRGTRGKNVSIRDCRNFLESIGYVLPDPGKVAVRTDNVDPEIATIAGPQLVVPLSNARYAVNAANARWGSLCDALYGTDGIPDSWDCARGPGYNEARRWTRTTSF
jgi:malate synthase